MYTNCIPIDVGFYARKYRKRAVANSYNWEDPQVAREVITHIQEAMKMWDLAGTPDAKAERKRLSKKIEPVKLLSLKAMRTIPGPTFDLRDAIHSMEEWIEGSSFEETIFDVTRLLLLKKPEEVRESARERLFFSAMFPTTKIDSKGRKQCIVPSLLSEQESDVLARLEYIAAGEYKLMADAMITRYLRIAKQHFTYDTKNLEFLVERNAFIPEKRKNSFLKGLIAGYDFDFVTSMQLLMPQVENAIRELAEVCGAVTYKTDTRGVEESLSLESILNLPEMKECMDEEILFNMKVFYTSEYGIGMRNIVSHGLYSDDELQSKESLAVWCFTLYLCCIYCPELYDRINQCQEKRKSARA